MRSVFIKKVVASTLLFSLVIGAGFFNSKNVQAVTNHHYDVQYSMGMIAPIEFTTYEGMNAIVIPIPNDTEYKNVFIENAPEDLVQVVYKDKIVLAGLKEGQKYENLSLIVMCLNMPESMDYKYMIDTFTFNSDKMSGNKISHSKMADNCILSNMSLSDYLSKSSKILLGSELSDKEIKEVEKKLMNKQYSLSDFFKSLVSKDAFLNSSDNNQEKIKKMYLSIFLREADKNGLEYWTKKFNEKMESSKNLKDTFKFIVAEFSNSDEFKKIATKFEIK